MNTVELRLCRQRHSSSERYERDVVSVRSNESLNMEAELRKEKIRRGSDCYIRQIITLDLRRVRLFMYETFR